jgi:tetratricopeptide (TPR) repeat protein
MTRLRFDGVQEALPELDELRPVLDHLLAVSVPDPDRRWAGSGELDTAGARLVETGDWHGAAKALADGEGAHLARVYEAVLRAVACIEQQDHAGAAQSLLQAATMEERRNRSARAEAYASRAVSVARRHGEPRLLATALRRQGRAARAIGRLSDAERLYAAGHELARDAGDTEGAAEGAIGAGNVLEEQGRWHEAARWYRTALDLLAATPGPRPEQWQALLNLHVATRSLGQAEESVEWLRRAEEVVDALDDDSARGLIHNAWGQLYMARREFGEAVLRLRDAVDSPASPWARVNFRLNLGEALLAGGLPLDAAEEVREAEREALTSGVAAKLPEVYRLLGRIAASRGNADAFVLFERALRIVRERALPAIEEAVSLQAYAAAIGELDPERAHDMRERAAGLYRQLGLGGERATWAETYGAAGHSPADAARAARPGDEGPGGEP